MLLTYTVGGMHGVRGTLVKGKHFYSNVRMIQLKYFVLDARMCLLLIEVANSV